MTAPLTECAVPGCARPTYARGWCVTHYRRWSRHGDPQPDRPITARLGDGTGYAALLRRLAAERGPATGYGCEECGGPAACWSYTGDDPDERTDSARGVRYSLDLARYRPRCRFCHRQAVLARSVDVPGSTRGRSALDVQRAVRLYRAGASCRGIGSLMGVSPDAIRRALRSHGVTLRPSGRSQW